VLHVESTFTVSLILFCVYNIFYLYGMPLNAVLYEHQNITVRIGAPKGGGGGAAGLQTPQSEI
jgi:hypothetical protein